MSSTNLSRISEARPELSNAVDRISDWWSGHPTMKFLDTRSVVHDLGSVLTNREILDFFRALREMGIAHIHYRVIDQNGDLTGTQEDTIDELPAIDEDSFGNRFKVKRRNILQVYECK